MKDVVAFLSSIPPEIALAAAAVWVVYRLMLKPITRMMRRTFMRTLMGTLTGCLGGFGAMSSLANVFQPFL